MRGPLHAAVDLGAGSGRVLVGGFAERVTVEEAHRFTYPPRESAGHLRWDFDRLLDGIQTGLRRAAAIATREGRPLSSIGVDSWGVDYGLIDGSGGLIEDPICYRDPRTAGMLERACARWNAKSFFARRAFSSSRSTPSSSSWRTARLVCRRVRRGC